MLKQNFIIFYKIIDLVRFYLLVILFSSVVIVCFVDVCMRYFLQLGSLGWAEELMRYLGIWIVFLGMSIGFKRGVHIKMYFLAEKLFKNSKSYKVFIDVITLIFLFIVLLFGFKQALNNIPQVCVTLPFSIAWIYFGIPIGTTYSIIDCLLISFSKNGVHPFLTKHEKSEEEFEPIEEKIQ